VIWSIFDKLSLFSVSLSVSAQLWSHCGYSRTRTSHIRNPSSKQTYVMQYVGLCHVVAVNRASTGL